MASRRTSLPDHPKFLILGLGNPGEEYARTRHNIGALVADEIAHEAHARFVRGVGPMRVATLAFGGELGLVVKPISFMNRSGDAARPLRASYPDLPLSRWLVVADDLDLPFGRLRFRAGGGPGGHNGLRSIIDALQTPEFPRLRLGIGRPAGSQREVVVDFVLQPFTDEESEELPRVLASAVEGVRTFAREGIAAAMNRTNAGASRSLQPPGGDA